MTKTKIIMLFSINPFDEDRESLYSNHHIMTNKELVNQVWGFTSYISKYYLPATADVKIAVASTPNNGAKVVVGIGDMTVGYTCTVYSICKRLKIVEQICDMFANDPTTLCDDDKTLLTKGED